MQKKKKRMCFSGVGAEHTSCWKGVESWKMGGKGYPNCALDFKNYSGLACRSSTKNKRHFVNCMENWRRESCFTRTMLLHTRSLWFAMATVYDWGLELVAHPSRSVWSLSFAVNPVTIPVLDCFLVNANLCSCRLSSISHQNFESIHWLLWTILSLGARAQPPLPGNLLQGNGVLNLVVVGWQQPPLAARQQTTQSHPLLLALSPICSLWKILPLFLVLFHQWLLQYPTFSIRWTIF